MEVLGIPIPWFAMSTGPTCGPAVEGPRDPLKTEYNPLKTLLGLPRDFGLPDLWLSET
jgi:hypothetical protein